jgi:hypothetical protein
MRRKRLMLKRRSWLGIICNSSLNRRALSLVSAAVKGRNHQILKASFSLNSGKTFGKITNKLYDLWYV